MDEDQKKIIHVEELNHFPFNNFREFRKAILEGGVQLGVDRGSALHWAQNGVYAPRFLRLQTNFFAFLPFIALIGFVIWVLISKSWLMLLGLPVFLIAFFLFHPSSAPIFGVIRTSLIGLSFIGLIYAFLIGKPWLLALCITLIVIWYAVTTAYKIAINHLIKTALDHEDLLCILWQSKYLNVRFLNENSYWVDYKIENGESIYYGKQ